MAVTITRPQAVACVGWCPWPPTSNQDQDDDGVAEEIEGESPYLTEAELGLEAEEIEGESPALIEEQEFKLLAAEMEGESPCLIEEDLEMDDDSPIPVSVRET